MLVFATGVLSLAAYGAAYTTAFELCALSLFPTIVRVGHLLARALSRQLIGTGRLHAWEGTKRRRKEEERKKKRRRKEGRRES